MPVPVRLQPYSVPVPVRLQPYLGPPVPYPLPPVPYPLRQRKHHGLPLLHHMRWMKYHLAPRSLPLQSRPEWRFVQGQRLDRKAVDEPRGRWTGLDAE